MQDVRLTTIQTIEIGDLEIELERKQIKNLHLRVYPPVGKVKVSAPLRMSIDNIRRFVSSKREWIARQQQKIRSQTREPQREFSDGESHYLWGKSYLLDVIEIDAPPKVNLQGDRLLLYIRPSTDLSKKRAAIGNFYRDRLELAIPPLIAKWEPIMGVRVTSFNIRKMKTKWGCCTPALGTVRFNLELAKKPIECLEYVVVHELVHLLEASHNKRFMALMDAFLPDWRSHQTELNRISISIDS